MVETNVSFFRDGEEEVHDRTMAHGLSSISEPKQWLPGGYLATGLLYVSETKYHGE